MNDFFKLEELKEATGYSRNGDLLKWLEKNNIEHYESRGMPVVPKYKMGDKNNEPKWITR